MSVFTKYLFFNILDRYAVWAALCNERMAQLVSLNLNFREVFFDQIYCCLTIFKYTCMHYIENVVASERLIF